ncbi:MAG: tetratricopeptide repeat protein [Methylacidiphilales bacterium]|nr:tetratricopeptide repeat protein [Candidatus Methylacidiphilales bacterium]
MELRELGRVEAAEAACQAALGIDPQNLGALRLLASLLKARGALDEALHSLETAAALRPEDAGIAGQCGNLLRQMGRLEAAEARSAGAWSATPRIRACLSG